LKEENTTQDIYKFDKTGLDAEYKKPKDILVQLD
jgi:hypothetical protein